MMPCVCRFSARSDCVERLHGDLARIAGAEDQRRYAGYVAELEVRTGGVRRRFWVGLTQRLWTTSDGI